MTPAQAAEIIGCTSAHVRYLCREGVIRAERVPMSRDPVRYEYVITYQEAVRYRENRPKRGPVPKS